MTTEELRALDAEVHRKVFGKRAEWIASEPFEFKGCPESPLGTSCNFGGQVFTADREWLADDWLDPDANREVPRYSEDMAATSLVLEAWQGDVLLRRQNGYWNCELFRPSDQWDAWGETPSEAVCRARLLAAKGV